MALGNILGTSYGVASVTQYRKHLSQCCLALDVYTDSTKATKVTELFFQVPEANFATYFALTEIGGADKDILKAAYTYLKTLPAFTGATDV